MINNKRKSFILFSVASLIFVLLGVIVISHLILERPTVQNSTAQENNSNSSMEYHVLYTTNGFHEDSVTVTSHQSNPEVPVLIANGTHEEINIMFKLQEGQDTLAIPIKANDSIVVFLTEYSTYEIINIQTDEVSTINLHYQ